MVHVYILYVLMHRFLQCYFCHLIFFLLQCHKHSLVKFASDCFLQMYEAIVLGLQEAANDPETTITLIEGSGDYYCSGNDLGNFMKIKSPDDIPAMAASANKLLL